MSSNKSLRRVTDAPYVASSYISFQDWTKGAEQYCERFPNPRKVHIVKRNLDSVQAALKEREKRCVVFFF
jgi:hypothetical protein